MEEKYSDASGEFTFNFNAREGYQYYVQAIKYQYWNDQSNNIEFVEYADDDVIVYINPEGYLKIKLTSINEYNSFDYISISDFGAFYESPVDTIIYQTVYGNQENRIVWGVVIDGIPPLINEMDSIYCPAFDTTYYEILY